MERTLWKAGTPGEHCVVYHNGRILVTVNGSLWHVITLDAGDLLLLRPGERERYSSEQYNYILESRGELLWVTVQFKIYYDYGTVFMEVYTLDGEASATPEKTQWMRKDGRSLADRVLFLGCPNTFAMDASLLSGHGGCAYFVYPNGKAFPRNGYAVPIEQYGVFRYNLIENKVKLIERLPRGWCEEKCTWLVPQPAMAQIQVNTCKTSHIYFEHNSFVSFIIK